MLLLRSIRRSASVCLGSALLLVPLSSHAQDKPPADRPAPPELPRPPETPAVINGPGCAINVNEHRDKYAELFDFLQNTSFQGSEQVFKSRKDAMKYYFSKARLEISEIREAANTPDAPRKAKKQGKRDAKQAREELKEERKALRSEIKEIRSEFPKGECRKLAWALLGQADVSDSAIEANATEGASAEELVEE